MSMTLPNVKQELVEFLKNGNIEEARKHAFDYERARDCLINLGNICGTMVEEDHETLNLLHEVFRRSGDRPYANEVSNRLVRQ